MNERPPIRRVASIARAGSWPVDQAHGTVTLRYADRFRRRMRLIDDNGEAVFLDLERTTAIGEGDGLRLDAGGWLRARVAEEQVLDITAASHHAALQLAWHIGNRHAPMEILGDDRLRVLDDPVLSDLMCGLGAKVVVVRAPFSPEESGAQQVRSPLVPPNGPASGGPTRR